MRFRFAWWIVYLVAQLIHTMHGWTHRYVRNAALRALQVSGVDDRKRRCQRAVRGADLFHGWVQACTHMNLIDPMLPS